MRLLLDTPALLWWLPDDSRLSSTAREAIAKPLNQVLISAVSGWEMSIKQALGKLDVDLNALQSEIEKNGFSMLPISFNHGLAVGALPPHHRDPFDRMLVAQAQTESLHLISTNAQLIAYDVDLLW